MSGYQVSGGGKGKAEKFAEQLISEHKELEKRK